MRHMYFLTGAPGSGKSTYVKNVIKRHKLGRVISWDDYRNRFRDPHNDETYDIPVYVEEDGVAVETSVKPLTKAQEKMAIDISYMETEMHVRNGETIFIDNTNTKVRNMRCFLDLAERYAYKVWFIDIQGDQTLEQVLEQNAYRVGYKRVPDEIVANMHARNIELRANWRNIFQDKDNIKGYIAPDALIDNLKSYVNFQKPVRSLTMGTDFGRQYERVCIFGDIQGMGDTLEAAIHDLSPDKGLHDMNTLWIFIGDLFDRGNNPTKVAELVLPHLLNNARHVKLINGNHESQVLNAYAGANTNKDTLSTIRALRAAGYGDAWVKTALTEALPAAELRLDSVDEDGSIYSKYLYLTHAGAHPKLHVDSLHIKEHGSGRGNPYGSIYRLPLKYWETGYSDVEDFRYGYSTYKGWAEPLNDLYAKATRLHVENGGHPKSELVAVCGHRGGYGDPAQYSNLIPLESEVEYEGGALSVAVFTARKVKPVTFGYRKTFKHVWDYERREYPGNSDAERFWVSTSEKRQRK